MTRLIPQLLLAAVMLTAWAPSAAALHPAPFPHEHVQEAAPRPPEARPRREPVGAHSEGALSVGLGLSGTVTVNTGNALSAGLGNGVGFNLYVGWRLNPWAAVDLEWFTTFHETTYADTTVIDDDPSTPEVEERVIQGLDAAMFGSASGLVRIYLLDPGMFEPYVALGVSLFMLSGGVNSETSLTGLGFAAGGGAELNLSDTIGLGAKVLYRGAFFDNTKEPIPLEEVPQEASFVNMLTFSAHLRLKF
jgi:opacity protein-like surface antigen